MMRSTAWGIAALAAAAGAAWGDTIKVPADQPTIQAGIDASKDGDTVLVADGTYTGPGNRNLDFKGRLITVKSEHGPSKSTIDCQGAARAAVFDDFEVQDTTMDGFTLVGGSAPRGGAVLVSDAGPTFRNCIFKSNAASGSGATDGGGAVAVADGGNPRFFGCTFDGNSGRSGGAILFDAQSVPTIESCVFTANTAGSGGSGGAVAFLDRSKGSATGSTFSKNKGPGGGAVYVSGLSTPAFLNCKLDSNEATAGNGGAVLADTAAGPTFTGCSFTGNKASAGGAAAGNDAGLPSFTNGVFSGNSAATAGGALWYSGGSLNLAGCALVSNTAPSGGGLRTSGVVVGMYNCTLTANAASGGSGGGVLAEDASEFTIANSILYGNTAGAAAEMRLSGGGILFMSYSDVLGGQPGIVTEGGSTVVWLAGNIDSNPLFLSPTNVRLAPDGPCIDAADNSAVPGTMKFDPDGTPRFVDDPTTPDTGAGTAPIVDMGAYEYRCPPDCNTDGRLNINDFICFQAKWKQKEFYADFDGSGTWTINDFIRFQAAFVRGCP